MTIAETIKNFVNRLNNGSQVWYVSLDRKVNAVAKYSARVYKGECVCRPGEENFVEFVKEPLNDYSERLYVSLDTGAIYGNPMNPLGAYDLNTPICHIDKEIAQILLTFYKDRYLEPWCANIKMLLEQDSDFAENFVGIRDGFSVLCNDLGVLPWNCDGDIRKVQK